MPVHPLSQRTVIVDQQTHHITAAAGVGADAARMPLNDGGPGEGRQDDTLTSGAGTFHVHIDWQLQGVSDVDAEIGDHGLGSFGML